jgi:tRNA A-37 threonylcarbamoyl transferase component Bud32
VTGDWDDGVVTQRRLAHGYTNECWSDGDRVVKQYRGPDAVERLQTEVGAMERAVHAIPVPRLLEVDVAETRVVMTFMPGRHGQDLIEEGHANRVLRATGRTLRRLQDGVPGLVHGDYGPQNQLLDPGSLDVLAVLDWEFAHDGDPVEDLAWAEWIVRLHHPDAVEALPALFDGYGHRPAWPERHTAMLLKCAALRDVCLRRGDEPAAEMWSERASVTSHWHDQQ